MFNRSRRHIACWFTLSMGSILIFFTGIVYYREVQDQLQSFDQQLYKKGKAMASGAEYRFYRGRWWVDLADVPLLGSKQLPLDGDLTYARWYNPQGQLVQFFGATAPEKLTVGSGLHTTRTTSNNRAIFSETWSRQLTLPVVHGKQLLGYLQVATPLNPLREELAQTRLFLSLGLPITLSLIGFTGWFLSGIAMQPIRRAYGQLQRFTADASHELRAPLSAILSNAQVGLLSPVGDDAAVRHRLENIVESTKSMSTLISNLLFLARHEGKLPAETLKTVDLVSLLETLIAEYAAVVATKDLKFVTQLPEHPVSLRADPDLLQQAVRNLLNNAFNYTPAAGKVQFRLFAQPNRVIIQVEDNGSGIPAADLPHIFERFYRVDAARSRQTGGFGLGLSIVQQIITAHGGQVTVKSTVGQGTTFQVELPL